MLDKLTNEQLIRIIQWTLNDLDSWNNNKNGVLPEVKRFTRMFEEAVNYQKEKDILKVAHVYLENLQLELPVRFDIISIILNDQKSKLDHLVDSFSSMTLEY